MSDMWLHSMSVPSHKDCVISSTLTNESIFIKCLQVVYLRETNFLYALISCNNIHENVTNVSK